MLICNKNNKTIKFQLLVCIFGFNNLKKIQKVLRNLIFYDILINVLERSRGVAVNMPACHAGDRRFDPGRDRHLCLYSSCNRKLL